MKTLLSLEENLDLLFKNISENCTVKPEIIGKKIQFILNHDFEKFIYILNFSNNGVFISKVFNSEPDLQVECKANNWFKICRKQLNPVWGVISGKLKLKGDKSLLSALSTKTIEKDNFPGNEDLFQEYENADKRKWEMPKEALLISASPRGKNSYTHLILEQFKKGLERAGVHCETITLKEHNIKECTGCWNCWIKGEGKCVFNDDMDTLDSLYYNADLIVHAFPVYVSSVPSLLKKYMDRQTRNGYPFMVEGQGGLTRHPRRKPKKQYMAVISSCGFPETSTFDPIKAHYTQMCHNKHLGLTDFILLTEAIFAISSPISYDIIHHKFELIEQAGYELAQNGRIKRKILKQIIKPIYSKREMYKWRDFANTNWKEKIENKDTEY